MASQVIELCNAALVKLGAKTITSFTDGSAQATACSDSYTRILRAELRDHPWSFAKRLVSIVEDAAAPPFGRAHAYQLPLDFIRLLDDLVEDNTGDRDWEIHGQKIHTDESSPIQVRYIRRIEQIAISAITKASPGVVTTTAPHRLDSGDIVRITGCLVMTQVNDIDFMVNIPEKVITAITNASPGVVTSASHGFSNGDRIFIGEIVGMTELNNREFLVAGVTANTFTLTDLAGTAINTTSYGVYASDGIVRNARKFELYSAESGAKVDSSAYGTHTASSGVVELLIKDPLFKEAFSTRLALEICDRITQSNTKKQLLEGEYRKVIRRAKRQNAFDRPPEGFAEDLFLRCRT